MLWYERALKESVLSCTRTNTTDNTFIKNWLIFLRLDFYPCLIFFCFLSAFVPLPFVHSFGLSVGRFVCWSLIHALFILRLDQCWCFWLFIHFTSVYHLALNSGLAPIDWHKSLDKKDILIENELQRLRNRLHCIHKTHWDTRWTEKYT